MMKKYLFFLIGVIIFIGSPQILMAQGDDDDDPQEVKETKNYRNKNEVKTLSGSGGHSGGFGALAFKGTQYMDETMVFMGLRGGWIINRVVAIGFEGWGIIPTVKLQGIDQSATDAVVLGGYGGLFLEGIIFSNQIVHLTIPVSGGAGWIGYQEDFYYNSNSNSDLISDDVFWYIEPGVAIELNVARSFRMDFGVSKRFTQDLSLADTPSDAFDKLSYFLTLKFGRF